MIIPREVAGSYICLHHHLRHLSNVRYKDSSGKRLHLLYHQVALILSSTLVLPLLESLYSGTLRYLLSKVLIICYRQAAETVIECHFLEIEYLDMNSKLYLLTAG